LGQVLVCSTLAKMPTDCILPVPSTSEKDDYANFSEHPSHDIQ